MFEPSKPDSSALPGTVLALATEKNLPMTLTEEVLALFQQLRDPLFGVILRITQDPAEAEDLTQESFLRLFRHLKERRPLVNPKGWLFKVGHNLAIDRIRNESHVADMDEAMWSTLEQSRTESQADPESIMLQNERLDRLHLAVLNLTSLQRRCLHLRADGLRYREIAEVLGLSISTVVDAIRRATVKLGKEFENGVCA
jgi:RNA polymerase sigma-70 factor (ECF subfamily)